jgi:hypothetical protein
MLHNYRKIQLNPPLVPARSETNGARNRKPRGSRRAREGASAVPCSFRPGPLSAAKRLAGREGAKRQLQWPNRFPTRLQRRSSGRPMLGGGLEDSSRRTARLLHGGTRSEAWGGAASLAGEGDLARWENASVPRRPELAVTGAASAYAELALHAASRALQCCTLTRFPVGAIPRLPRATIARVRPSGTQSIPSGTPSRCIGCH